jgi:hypothetical protein
MPDRLSESCIEAVQVVIDCLSGWDKVAPVNFGFHVLITGAFYLDRPIARQVSNGDLPAIE